MDERLSYNDATCVTLAAQNNTLAACWFTGSGSVSGESVILYLDGSYQWQNFELPGETETFPWNSDYVDSYWRFGPGFVVGTCLAGTTAYLQIIHWQRNFADFLLTTEILDGGAQITLAGANALYNAGELYRYNGATWVKYSSKLSSEASDLVAATDDAVLRVRPDGSDCRRGFGRRWSGCRPTAAVAPAAWCRRGS